MSQPTALQLGGPTLQLPSTIGNSTPIAIPSTQVQAGRGRPVTQRIVRHLKWIAAPLTIILTALTFIGLQPSFKSVPIAEKGNELTAVSNEIAKWQAWLSFKQDCEARLSSFLPVSSNCSNAVRSVTPPPPHTSYIHNGTLHSLVKRSLHLVQESTSQILPTEWLSDGATLSDPRLLQGLGYLGTLLLAILVWRGGRSCMRNARDWLDRARGKSGIRSRQDRDWIQIYDLAGNLRDGRVRYEDVGDPNGYWSLQARFTTNISNRCVAPDSTLCEAAAVGNVPRVEQLLRLGVDPNVVDTPQHYTPLILCMVYSSTCNPRRAELRRVAQLLLENGADPLVTDANGITALMHACRRGLLEEVQVLLTKHNDVNHANVPAKITALHFTCTGNIKPPCAWMILRPTEAPIPIRKEFSAIAQLLIENGANVDCVDGHGRTPLHRAMCTGDLRVPQRKLVSTLIELGANPYLQDLDGKCPTTSSGQDVFALMERDDWLTSGAKHKLKKWKGQSSTSQFVGAARKRHVCDHSGNLEDQAC